MSKHYNWCYTINNPTEDDIEKLLIIYSSAVNYFAQEEICPKTKTPHIQGFICFKSQRTMRSLSKYIPRGRLSVMYKSVLANFRYCSKDKSRAPNGRRWCFEIQDKPMSPLELFKTENNIKNLKCYIELIKDEIFDMYCNGRISWEDMNLVLKKYN